MVKTDKIIVIHNGEVASMGGRAMKYYKVARPDGYEGGDTILFSEGGMNRESVVR